MMHSSRAERHFRSDFFEFSQDFVTKNQNDSVDGEKQECLKICHKLIAATFYHHLDYGIDDTPTRHHIGRSCQRFILDVVLRKLNYYISSYY